MTHGWETHEGGRACQRKINPKDPSLLNTCHKPEFNREILLNPPNSAPHTIVFGTAGTQRCQSPRHMLRMGLEIWWGI